MSVIPNGAQLYIVDVTSSDRQIVEVECVTQFNVSGSTDQIEDTCLEDFERSYKPGLRTQGQATFSTNADPKISSHVLLHEMSKVNPSPVTQWAMGWSDGTEPPTLDSNGHFIFPSSRTWYTFEGYISDITFNFQQNAVVTAEVVVEREIQEIEFIGWIGQGGFDPASLFVEGEQGGWYVSSPTHEGVQVLWKDVAGTDPVTTDGDIVRKRDDLSGNGNHATDAGAGVVYRTDGTLHWLEPNGVDGQLMTGTIDLSSFTKLAVFAAIRKTSDGQGVAPNIMSGPTGSTANGFAMYAPHSATNRKVAWSLGGSAQRFRAVDDFAAPVTLVQSCRFDNVATALSDAIRPRINSQLQTVFSVTVTGTAGGGGFRSDTIRFYVQDGTGDFSSNLDYGQIWVTGDPGDESMTKTEEYLSNLAGI